MKKLSEEQLAKKGKMFLMMPFVVVPFVTLIFWALGGGSGKAAAQHDLPEQVGLNTQLPGAKNKDDGSLDKMGFYELADRDSLKRKEAIQNDPYYSKAKRQDTVGKELLVEKDENEEKVYHKIDELNRELEKPLNPPAHSAPPLLTKTNNNTSSEDVERLEGLLTASRQRDSAIDPETHALNGMLEKILDIQHPDRVKDKLRKVSEENKGVVLPVYTNDNAQDIHATENNSADQRNEPERQVIPAEVAESRELYNGASIKIRLLSDIFISGRLIPYNTFVSGMVSFDNARMHILVSSIYFDGNLYPVQLSVFDPKGVKGLELDANIQYKLTRQSGERGVQSMNIGSLDPSIGAQAATAGIEVVKNIASKRFRQIRVPVKAGERVLLMSEPSTR